MFSSSLSSRISKSRIFVLLGVTDRVGVANEAFEYWKVNAYWITPTSKNFLEEIVSWWQVVIWSLGTLWTYDDLNRLESWCITSQNSAEQRADDSRKWNWMPDSHILSSTSLLRSTFLVFCLILSWYSFHYSTAVWTVWKSDHLTFPPQEQPRQHHA